MYLKLLIMSRLARVELMGSLALQRRVFDAFRAASSIQAARRAAYRECQHRWDRALLLRMFMSWGEVVAACRWAALIGA